MFRAVICSRECDALRDSHNVDAVELTVPDGLYEATPGTSMHLGSFVQSLLIRKLPVPQNTTSLDRIVEFREDAESKASLMRLRRWISSTAKSGLSAVEVAQELEWMLQEYEEYMRLHEVKIVVGSLQTFVTLGAEIAEDLLKVKWGKVAQSLFVTPPKEDRFA